MNRRGAGVATIALVAIALASLAIGGVATAQDGSGNQTGDYSLAELQDGGVEIQDGPASQRFLSDYGSATIRHEPVGLFQSGWQYLEPETTIHADHVTLRTVRLAPSGEIQEELTVTVVAWERGTEESVRGNRTVGDSAAVNQTVRRQRVSLERGYDEAQIDLPSNFDRTAEVTMWVDEYDDARWRFQHRSSPGAQSVDIDSASDAQTYAVQNATLPGLLGIIVGLVTGVKTRNRTGRGPGYGLIIWAIIGGILTFGILSAAYFQVAVVLDYLPWMLAFPLFVIAYGGALVMAGSTTTIAFERDELFTARIGPEDETIVTAAMEDDVDDAVADADDDDPDVVTDGGVVETNGQHPPDESSEETVPQSPDSESGPGSGLSDIKEVLYQDQPQLPAIEAPDGTIRVPVTGIRPFLARLFADAAALEKSDLTTKIEVDQGPVDEKIIVDPEVDEPVIHEPARLERRWPVMHSVDEDAGTMNQIGAIVGMLIVVVGIPFAGWTVGGQLGVPALGAAVGALPALVSAYTANDGYIDFVPANEHFKRARATLVDLQREQADGKTLDSFREEAWRERARTAEEALELGESQDRTLSEELLSNRVGFDLAGPDESTPDDRDPDAGGDSDDD